MENPEHLKASRDPPVRIALGCRPVYHQAGRCGRRAGPCRDGRPTAATMLAVRGLGRRYQHVDAEITLLMARAAVDKRLVHLPVRKNVAGAPWARRVCRIDRTLAASPPASKVSATTPAAGRWAGPPGPGHRGRQVPDRRGGRVAAGDRRRRRRVVTAQSWSARPWWRTEWQTRGRPSRGSNPPLPAATPGWGRRPAACRLRRLASRTLALAHAHWRCAGGSRAAFLSRPPGPPPPPSLMAWPPARRGGEGLRGWSDRGRRSPWSRATDRHGRRRRGSTRTVAGHGIIPRRARTPPWRAVLPGRGGTFGRSAAIAFA